eukprot:CAMPEP_0196822066 /NCGR_PEP_ID=MMETSP1362-20130617/82035_1 /TAXON_ID=163516 /ORGANISM="Leptocylindrus danicus, Strain CCMP1856" /LENGTH=306 /DNA_ID=CAMNT_0042201513 /DNA_START=114 /DNA_END=1031 /DNA_ORIENTATION=-
MSSSGTQKQGEHDIQSRQGFDDDNDDGGPAVSSSTTITTMQISSAGSASEAITSSMLLPSTGEEIMPTSTTTETEGASAIQEPTVPATRGAGEQQGDTIMEETTGEATTTNIQGDSQQQPQPQQSNIPSSAAVAAASTEGQDIQPQIPVIAVSASKTPTVFFNLARRFLVNEEVLELSALEGAIVSAVDAAHLLERSRLANIVRVETSYVVVEPRRKKLKPQQDQTEGGGMAGAASQSAAMSQPLPVGAATMAAGGTGAMYVAGTAMALAGATAEPKVKQEQRRARIIITVRRTEEYRQWLIENPH